MIAAEYFKIGKTAVKVKGYNNVSSYGWEIGNKGG